MFEYREKATANNEVEEPHFPDNRAYPGVVGDTYMELGAQYGLDDDMTIGNPGDNRPQTVDEEYQAYVTAQCSSKDVTSLKFWEVGGDINGVNLLTRHGRSTGRCFQHYSRWRWTTFLFKHRPYHVSACFRRARKRIRSGGIASATSQWRHCK